MITILAVDDEPLNNDFMSRVFRKCPDRRLLTALSGQDGLQILATNSVDLILVDYSMPGMNGVEFLERARTIAPKAVAVMVTGYPELEEVIDARSRGLMREILAKPLVSKELFDTVDRAIASL